MHIYFCKLYTKCLSRNLVQMGDVSNQKLTCCWSSSLLYLALGEWTHVPGLHERTDKGIGWLGPLLVDSHDSQAATVPAPALQHTFQNTSFIPFPISGLPPVSCPWSSLTSVWVLKNLCLKHYLDYLAIVWVQLCDYVSDLWMLSGALK